MTQEFSFQKRICNKNRECNHKFKDFLVVRKWFPIDNKSMMKYYVEYTLIIILALLIDIFSEMKNLFSRKQNAKDFDCKITKDTCKLGNACNA